MKKPELESKIDNVVALRNEVTNVFNELRAGKIELGHAKELFNGAGKIMNLAKLQMEYNYQMKNQRKIPWLDIPEEEEDSEN